MKTQTTGEDKIFAKDMQHLLRLKNPHPKYNKDSKLNSKKTNKPIKKEVKGWSSHFTKECI